MIESILVSTLKDVLSPVNVTTMDDNLVNKVAGESEENREQREQLQKQLEVLKKGFITCKHFEGDAFYGILPLSLILSIVLTLCKDVEKGTTISTNEPFQTFETKASHSIGEKKKKKKSNKNPAVKSRSALEIDLVPNFDNGTSCEIGEPLDEIYD